MGHSTVRTGSRGPCMCLGRGLFLKISEIPPFYGTSPILLCRGLFLKIHEKHSTDVSNAKILKSLVFCLFCSHVVFLHVFVTLFSSCFALTLFFFAFCSHVAFLRVLLTLFFFVFCSHVVFLRVLLNVPTGVSSRFALKGGAGGGRGARTIIYSDLDTSGGSGRQMQLRTARAAARTPTPWVD